MKTSEGGGGLSKITIIIISAVIPGFVFIIGLVIGMICLIRWIKQRDKGPKRVKRSQREDLRKRKHLEDL